MDCFFYNLQLTLTIFGTGIGLKSSSLAIELYSRAFVSVIKCSSAQVAEAAKLVENIYRNVNIALVNEIKVMFQQKLGLDIHEILDAASTKPFGFQRFDPGKKEKREDRALLRILVCSYVNV